MGDPRHLLGVRAEEAVAGFLAASGWRILERRWRGPYGEIDLVCHDPHGALVGVEVKLRTSGRSGTGPESIDLRRLGRLRRSLAHYAAGRHGAGLRIDLVTLEPADGGGWRLQRRPAIDGW